MPNIQVVGYPTEGETAMPAAVKEYDARIDIKKRVTIRGAQHEYYHVYEYENGKIILEPKVLVNPFEVSKNILGMMDTVIDNLKKGKTSKRVDLSSCSDK